MTTKLSYGQNTNTCTSQELYDSKDILGEENYYPETYNPDLYLWQKEFFDFYISSPTGNQTRRVPSPFYDQESGGSSANDMIAHFSLYSEFEKKDFSRDQGWVLLDYDFGVNDPQEPRPVKYPHLFLYNKYTGKLRLFICVILFEASSSVEITIKHKEEKDLTALFTFADSLIAPLEQPNARRKEINFIYPGGFGNTFGYPTWIYEEISLAYDPCICAFNKITDQGSEIELNAVSKNITHYSLSGRINGEIVTPNGNSPTHESSLSKFISLSTGAIGAFNSTLGTYSEFKDKINDLEDQRKHEIELLENSSPEFQNKQPYKAIRILLDWLGPGSAAAASASSLIPYIGTIPSALSFINGLMPSDKSTVSPDISIVDCKISLEGTGISTENPGLTKTFKIPESYSPTISNDKKTIYKNSLGVINFPYMPKLKKKYIKISNIQHNGSTYTTRGFVQFSLKEPIKVVLNPASNMEFEDIKLAVDYKFSFTNTGDSWWSHASEFKILNDYFRANKFFSHNDYPLSYGLSGPTPIGKFVINQDGSVSISKPLTGSTYFETMLLNDIIINEIPENGSLFDAIFSTPMVSIREWDKLNFICYETPTLKIEPVVRVMVVSKSKDNKMLHNTSVYSLKFDKHYQLNSIADEEYQANLEIDYNMLYTPGYFSVNGYLSKLNSEPKVNTVLNLEDYVFNFTHRLDGYSLVNISGNISTENNAKGSIFSCGKILLKPNTKLGAGVFIGNSCNIGSKYVDNFVEDLAYIRDHLCKQNGPGQYYEHMKVNMLRKASDSLPIEVPSSKTNPELLKIYQVFPNPANSTVTIQSPNSDEVISKVVIKNILGVEVASFVIKNPASEVSIDVSGVPIGIYKLSVNNFSTTLGIQR